VICARAVLDAVVAHAHAEAPRECCGILLGDGRAIRAAAPARNLAASATRYLIDPEDHIRIRRDARGRGLAVVGFYHSHPNGTPAPSATDLAEASYDDCVWLIVGLGKDVGTALFTIRNQVATELPLEVADG